MNRNEGTVGPAVNDFTEYEDISNIGFGVSLCCEGQISIPQDMISFVADLGAAKRDAGSTYAQNLWGSALLNLERSSGLPGAGW